VVLKPGTKRSKADVSLPFNQNRRTGRDGRDGTNSRNGTTDTNDEPELTASASASSNRTETFIASDNGVDVMRTTITTAFTGRIVANRSLEVRCSSGDGDVPCMHQIAASGSRRFTDLSQTDHAVFPSLSGASFDFAILLTAAAVEPAGTYLICGSRAHSQQRHLLVRRHGGRGSRLVGPRRGKDRREHGCSAENRS
jgi:hypothetical protein